NAGAFTQTSNSIVVSAAAASQLVVTTQPPSTASAGQLFGTQPEAAVEETFSNLITSDSTHTVTVARGTGTAALQGSPVTVTLASGVATFGGLSYNTVYPYTTLFRSNAGAFTQTSNSIVVSAAAASQLVMTT